METLVRLEERRGKGPRLELCIVGELKVELSGRDNDRPCSHGTLGKSFGFHLRRGSFYYCRPEGGRGEWFRARHQKGPRVISSIEARRPEGCIDDDRGLIPHSYPGGEGCGRGSPLGQVGNIFS